jgi:hypothetical protein
MDEAADTLRGRPLIARTYTTTDTKTGQPIELKRTCRLCPHRYGEGDYPRLDCSSQEAKEFFGIPEDEVLGIIMLDGDILKDVGFYCSHFKGL